MPNIVVIDHDDLMRELVQEWLVGAGYAVAEPSDGPEADLVIVDVYMPRDTGADVVSNVQRRFPHTPVIAISAQFRAGLDSSAAVARALGVERVIAKPFTRLELLDAIDTLIGTAK